MTPIKLVYTSAPADLKLREQLSAHLHTLVQQGLLLEWHEQRILAGADAAQERHLASTALPLSPSTSVDQHAEACSPLFPFVLPVPLDEWSSGCIIQWERGSSLLDDGLTHFCIAPSFFGNSNPRHRLFLLSFIRVDLHLQKQPDALENPWRLMVQELDHQPHPLPPGTSITQVFDEADEELLILGEPGAGKTTLLLYLTSTLLDRANADEHRRIPVIFHLSSWSQQRLPLERWLVEELKTKYQVPQPIGRAWVEADQIFPLLDGLDEVIEPARAACVQAIIAYTQRSLERTPLVVCCRSQEYQALSVQLPLSYAVMLLPFTKEQVDVYLSSVSGELDTLRQTLYADSELFELARRPLLLSVFTLAYHGIAADRPVTTMSHNYPRALFTYYIKHMLTRRTRLQQGTEEQFYCWLSYLATQLQRQQQTIFAVEYLQPAWLPERARRWYRWSMPLVYGLTFGLLFGPLFGLGFGCVYGLIHKTVAQFIFGILFGLIVGVIGGFVGGLIFGVSFKHHQTIQPAEATAWSWSASKKGLTIGLTGGLVVGLAGGLVGSLVAGPASGIVTEIVTAVLVGLVGGLVGGLSPVQLPERVALAPNEGIWRSGRRGLLFVMCCVLLFGIAGGGVFGILGTSIGSLIYGLLFGVVFGAVGGLIFGLAFGIVGGRTGIAAFLQHFVLRLYLWRLDLLPWKLVAFLDEATERLLLRKVGGNYIFVHRLLRDVLAAQEEEK